MIKEVASLNNIEYNADNWRGGAACNVTNAKDFMSDDADAKKRAYKTCMGCIVINFCRDDAISNRVPFFQGGLTAAQIRKKEIQNRQDLSFKN